MLYWDIVPEQRPQDANFASVIQMTLFAMSKTETRTRLISWPRIPNSVIPDPPHVSLPDPSLFDSITTSEANISAFYIDIHNMFHNITLPRNLSRLFPMEPIALRDLDQQTIQSLRLRLPLFRYSDDVLLRPYQATMPMGFKWSVYIAHNFATSCLRHAYDLFKSTKLAPPYLRQLLFLQRHSTPPTLTPSTPFMLHIIDDIVAITQNWPPQAVQASHRYVRIIFKLNKLPISEAKSCPHDYVESDSIKFIGCIWNLRNHTISPDPNKIASSAAQIKELLTARTVRTPTWKRIVGKLIWISLLNRPLLSITKAIFAAQLSEQPSYEPTNKARQELYMLGTLLPLASVNTALPVSNLLRAFDASLQAGAVTYTTLHREFAHDVWKQAKHYQYNPNPSSPEYLHLIHSLTNDKQNWTNSFTHHWRTPYTHINGLEAAAATLALEWVTRSGISNARITFLTDSMVVKGAFQK